MNKKRNGKDAFDRKSGRKGQVQGERRFQIGYEREQAPVPSMKGSGRGKQVWKKKNQSRGAAVQAFARNCKTLDEPGRGGDSSARRLENR